VQERPAARRLDEVARTEAVSIFETAAEGNAVVVAQLLAERGVEASVRTVQRAVADRRRELRAADLASVRFETAPGRQMQIDFGERRVWIGDRQVTVHFLVAVLSHSRRIFVKAFLHERQGHWLDGIASAFRHFAGVPLEVLGDNARCHRAWPGRRRSRLLHALHQRHRAPGDAGEGRDRGPTRRAPRVLRQAQAPHRRFMWSTWLCGVRRAAGRSFAVLAVADST